MSVLLAVNGTLMRGLEMNANLLAAGATFVREGRTAPVYRLWSIRDRHPAMVRVGPGGAAIALEVWSVPAQGLASILLKEPAGLCIGKVVLDDGRETLGVLGEPALCEGMREITGYGGCGADGAARGRAWRRVATSGRSPTVSPGWARPSASTSTRRPASTWPGTSPTCSTPRRCSRPFPSPTTSSPPRRSSRDDRHIRRRGACRGRSRSSRHGPADRRGHAREDRGAGPGLELLHVGPRGSRARRRPARRCHGRGAP